MACQWSVSWHLSLVGSSLCHCKPHERQAEKRPFSNDENRIIPFTFISCHSHQSAFQQNERCYNTKEPIWKEFLQITFYQSGPW